jgi:hypothetical protein
LLGQSPFDNRDGKSNNKTNGGWKWKHKKSMEVQELIGFH